MFTRMFSRGYQTVFKKDIFLKNIDWLKLEKSLVLRGLDKNLELLQNLLGKLDNTANKEIEDEISKLPNYVHPRIWSYGNNVKEILRYTPTEKIESKILEFSEICKHLNSFRMDHLGCYTGHKSYYLFGRLAELEQSLIQYAIDVLKQNGFRILSVPDILPEEIIRGCGMQTDGDRSQSYTPTTLKELLSFAIKYHEGNERFYVVINKSIEPFLDQLLYSMSVDAVKKFSNAITILQDTSSDQENIEALLAMKDYFETNIEFSNNFIKAEGGNIVMSYVKHTNDKVCSHAIDIVSLMADKNIFCQEYFFNHGAIELLTNYLKSDSKDLLLSALYALSDLLHNFEPAMTEFLKFHGIERLAGCLRTESSCVFFRLGYIITAMIYDNDWVKDEFAKLEVLDALIDKLQVIDNYDEEVDIALSVMEQVLESPYCNPNAAQVECVMDIVLKIIMNLETYNRCDEIVLSAKSVLRLLVTKFPI